MVNRPPPGSMPGIIPPDVASMMEAGFAQQAQQQKTNITQAPNQSNSLMQGSNLPGTQNTQAQGFQHQQKPRDLGSPTEEVKMALGDIAEGIASIPQSFLDMLGLGRPPKDPEEQSKLQQAHQGWQRLTAEQQQVAQHRIQAEKQRKEADEQMKAQKKAQEEQMAKRNELSVPHGKVSGQAALDKMNNDRKGMGGASG